MTGNLRETIDLLYQSGKETRERFHDVGNFLPITPAQEVIGLLSHCQDFPEQRFDDLIFTVSEILKSQTIKDNITDWPFENFWENPHETRHSKLLGYFLDPKSVHGCGEYLLKSFFEALKSKNVFHKRYFPVNEACEVEIESGHIDLLIKGENYAIIIENKVNRAQNQPNQLERYIINMHSRGYDYGDIFALFLPLTMDGVPNQTDLDFIKEKGVNYEKITFEEHILYWLDTAIHPSFDVSTPGIESGMRDNLTHYGNLISYLVNQHMKEDMRNKILDKLKEKGTLPDWQGVESLRQSATELQICMESVLRGKLLLEIKKELKFNGVESWLSIDNGNDRQLPQDLDSPYDASFEGGINLCVKINEDVILCAGSQPENDPKETFWYGFYRKNRENKQDNPAIQQIAENYFGKKNVHVDAAWYAWAYDPAIDYIQRQKDSTAKDVANKLLKMRGDLTNSLKS